MSRVLMIRPLDWVEKKHKISVSPPLGLMSLAAWARKERPGKDTFRIVHEHLRPQTLDDWTGLVKDWAPDSIAFSAMNLEVNRLKDLAAHFKRLFPHIPLVAGGPIASSMGKSLLENSRLDAVFQGEGEMSFVQWLEAFDKEGKCPVVPISGMAYRTPGGEILDFGGIGQVPEIDELPIPAWDLVDIKAYETRGRMTQIDENTPYAPLFNSRGCPYGCIYCHKIFSKKFRAMSASRVVNEIQFHLEHHGVRSFEIYDDIFNLDYNRAMEVFSLIIERGLDIEISFPNGVRGDLLDEPMIRAMKQAGVYSMAFAVESASPRIQKLAKKNIDLVKIRENIRVAQEAGIFTWGFFMLGFPGETLRELLRTLLFAITSNLHAAYFFSVIPFEGTELGQMVGPEQTLLPDRKAEEFDYFFSPNRLTAIGPTGLGLIQLLAFILFYLNPVRIWRIFCDWPRGKMELLQKFCKISRYLFWERPRKYFQGWLMRIPAFSPKST